MTNLKNIALLKNFSTSFVSFSFLLSDSSRIKLHENDEYNDEINVML